MLIELGRLFRSIPIDRQLRRGRKLGRFIIAIPGGLLAEAIIGRRALHVRIGLNDQPGEFCNGIASSVGSEIVVSHRTLLGFSIRARALTHTR